VGRERPGFFMDSAFYPIRQVFSFSEEGCEKTGKSEELEKRIIERV